MEKPVSKLYSGTVVEKWFKARKWKPFPFQLDLWDKWLSGQSGLLNAPTGSGKTMAVWIPAILEWLSEQQKSKKNNHRSGQMRILWLTPLRALAKDTEKALQNSISEMGLPWTVLRRTGDTSTSVRQKIERNPPDCLITTPETLHILISRKNHERYFRNLKAVVVDEWHELLSSKRGVMTELGLSRLRAIRPELKTWGVSATIGNMEQALEVLCGTKTHSYKKSLVRSDIPRKTRFHTLLPDRPEAFSWAGHIGTRLIPKILPVIHQSRSTLLFTNTRAQAEIWYQQLLEADPGLAGKMALHHGSLDTDIRQWVEDALHNGRLKLVVSTSSLDLGVDFSPVESVIQVGSPKGVARFMQRAGRSGHRPGAESKIWFVPTHGMEIIESAALQSAIKLGQIESRPPYEKPLDVLIQYTGTRALGNGFNSDELYREIKTTYAYRNLTEPEWNWVLQFLTSGGKSLKQYQDYQRLTKDESGNYVIRNRRLAARHRLSIGTITTDPSLKVRFVSGGFIGTVEESFIARLKKGDTFLFAGRYLEFVRLKELTVYVRKSKSSKGAVSRWMGGRMQLSTQLSVMIRRKIEDAGKEQYDSTEMHAARPLLELQQQRSALPGRNQLLIESIKTREGFHLFFYPMEGRMVHEGLSALLAHRISRIRPVSFSIAMNDYGFELLSPDQAPLDDALASGLFSTEKLAEDISAGINNAEMARRHFREIARISGLTFNGFPGRHIGARNLQANSGLLFDVFQQFDQDNLLLQQSYSEIMQYQLEFSRIAGVLESIGNAEIKITHPEKPTPFAFPIMVDRLHAKLSSEKLEDRIKRMKRQAERP